MKRHIFRSPVIVFFVTLYFLGILLARQFIEIDCQESVVFQSLIEDAASFIRDNDSWTKFLQLPPEEQTLMICYLDQMNKLAIAELKRNDMKGLMKWVFGRKEDQFARFQAIVTNNVKVLDLFKPAWKFFQSLEPFYKLILIKTALQMDQKNFSYTKKVLRYLKNLPPDDHFFIFAANPMFSEENSASSSSLEELSQRVCPEL